MKELTLEEVRAKLDKKQEQRREEQPHIDRTERAAGTKLPASPSGKPVEPIKAIPKPESHGMGPIMEAAMRPPVIVGRMPEIEQEAAEKTELPETGAAWLPRLEPIGNVIPTPDNPRRKIDEKCPKFLELVASVRSHGIIQALVGRPHPAQAGKIDLRAGHRRLRAAQVAGLKEVPITVRAMDDRTAMEITVIENMDREDLTPLEEARGVKLLKETGHNLDEIAASMGKSRGWIARRAALCSLSKKWQEFAEEHNVSAAHLELVARYDAPTQARLWDDLIKHGQWHWERYFTKPQSLEELKRYLAERNKELRLAQWKLDDALLLPEAGACAACPKRSGCQADLFEDEIQKGGDRCLDAGCWAKKAAAFVKRKEAELREKFPALVKVASRGAREETGKDVIGAYDYDTVAKSATGAVPALVVNGDSAGRQIWVKVSGGTRVAKQVQTAALKQAAASTDPKASAALLKERREMLEKRRWALVCRKLQERLDESELPPHTDYCTPEGLVCLAAAFGQEGAAYDPNGYRDAKGPWERMVKWRGREAMQKLWQVVRKCVINTLNVFTVGDLGKDHHKAIEGACLLLCVEVKQVKAEADEAIPVPKSFEQLERLAEAPAKKKVEHKETKETKLSKKSGGMPQGGDASKLKTALRDGPGAGKFTRIVERPPEDSWQTLRAEKLKRAQMIQRVHGLTESQLQAWAKAVIADGDEDERAVLGALYKSKMLEREKPGKKKTGGKAA